MVIALLNSHLLGSLGISLELAITNAAGGDRCRVVLVEDLPIALNGDSRPALRAPDGRFRGRQ